MEFDPMTLEEIRARFGVAQHNLRQINPRIKCHTVAVLGHRQYSLQEISPSNLDLLLNPNAFAQGQPLTRLARRALVYERLTLEIERIRKNTRAGVKARTKLAAREKAAAGIRAGLEERIANLQFVQPRFELRFTAIDMDSIQKIKQHPIVQRIGMTNMSPASIRVVIG